VEKNAFHCFSCKKRGNVLDLVAAMEDCGVREAAEKLADWFNITSSDSSGAPQAAPAQSKPETSRGEEREQNKPLTFQLKGINLAHPFLASRGIDDVTAEMFGVGFFPGRGSMAGRVVIPIHNERGELLAYAGRSIDGTEPKYKLPAGFHKSLELYNLHRAIKNNDQMMVVVVEGFFDCMKVTAAGWPCVALMGSSLSQTQEDLLTTHFQSAWLLFDGDEAGRNATKECVERLVRRMFVRVAELASGRQPDQMEPGEVRALLK
jgi:DNA primase